MAKKKTALKGSTKPTKSKPHKTSPHARYPRHSLEDALKIPKEILDQNAGKVCTDKVAGSFFNINNVRGLFAVEIGSGIKFGLIERPAKGKLALTELARQILRPKKPSDELDGLRKAVLKAPDVSDIYNHYRGENLPDSKFFNNTLIDTFSIPEQKINEFKGIFLSTLKKAKLLEERNGKQRVIDFSKGDETAVESGARLKKIGKDVVVDPNDTCFVMMPFAAPHGNYYSSVYELAIQKAGLKPVRADNEIFGAGKIMDQVWSGIKAAKVLLAELTTKNPNVFYELGLAHALKKPVVLVSCHSSNVGCRGVARYAPTAVIKSDTPQNKHDMTLVSSNEEDVPFDLQHIRVIYYDVNDPFWGKKLLDKVAENILSALKNPEEAIFEGETPD